LLLAWAETSPRSSGSSRIPRSWRVGLFLKGKKSLGGPKK
jgi:hypothetical protein